MKHINVAFDCKGTLMTHNTRVLALFKWFESKGCQMHIWSSLYSYTKHTQQMHKLKAQLLDKYSISDAKMDEKTVMDVAVDDDRMSSYLAAKNFIWVDEIPVNPEDFEKTYAHLLK